VAGANLALLCRAKVRRANAVAAPATGEGGPELESEGWDYTSAARSNFLVRSTSITAASNANLGNRR
jgi:hypothetical protein